ncbi:MAG TPA: hypothetical protein VFS43_09335 [Polyangiaceae bacterium]|nr:hypothetical protein [Polyangiaceae bacterium]
MAAPAPWAPRTAAPTSANARWAYLPARPARLSGRVPLGEGRQLLFGARGERWLWHEGSRQAEAAGELADQDLVAASRGAGGSWLFVGHKGSLYEADSPLGPFLRTRTPPEPVVRADAQGRTLLAVTARGTLLRSDDAGASFRPAAPGPGAVADVALVDPQVGLALTYPERLAATSDGGATWAPVDAPTVGAFRLFHEASGGVGVVGVERALRWRPGRPVDRLGAAPAPAALALEAELGPAPDAADLREGRGAVVGGEALALRPPPQGVAGPWSLGRAPLGERLRLAPLPGTEACAHLVLSAAPGALVLACSLAPTEGGLSSVLLLRAPGPEGPWASAPALLEGQPGDVRVVAGAGGQLLVTGGCRRAAKRSCDPDAPLWLPSWEQLPPPARPGPKPAASGEARAAGGEGGSPFRAVVAPSLRGRPLAMAFGPGGARAYLVGRRDKGDELTLFVSDDGGRSFQARDWGLAKREGAEPLAQPADAGDELKASLSVSDDDTVAVVMEGPARAWLATADGDGRMLTLQAPPGPEDVVRVGAYGRFALAVDGEGAFETLDGGQHWAALGPVATLACPGKRDECAHPVVCGPGGCVVGGDVARVGWGATPKAGREAPSEVATPPLPLPPPPLTCRLDRERWLPLPRGASLPGAAQADRGKVAWAVLAEDPARGSVSMVHAPASSAGRLEEVTLLGPTPQAGQMLVAAQPQVEGGVALRLNLPPPSAGNAERVGELAWENLFEGKTYRVTLRDQALLRPIRLRGRGAGVAARADPDLLSISAGGVFVVPQEVERNLFFVDARGKVERSHLPPLPAKTLDGDEFEASLEAARVDGRSLALGIADPWAFLRATAPGKTWDALALGRPDPSSGSSALVRLVYQGASPRLALFTFPPAPLPSSGQAFALRAEGPIVGDAATVPTQGALVRNYRPCSPADRAQSPRIVAPTEVGTRRGVLIESPDGSPLSALASAAMVLYGSAASPCAAALEATPLPAAGPARLAEGPQEGALVFLSDLEHGWFFRSGVSDERPLEARPMRCRFTPGASLPPALEQALRTRAPDARKARPTPDEPDEE